MATVLIVEDDLHVLFIADYALRAVGHKTIPAASLDDALFVLSSEEKIDALFTDLKLAGDKRAGLKVAKEAVKRRGGLGVIYTTGGRVRGPFLEESEFLPKPYTSRELALAVERTLRKAKDIGPRTSFSQKRMRAKGTPGRWGRSSDWAEHDE